MMKLRDRLVDHGTLSHLRNIACSCLVSAYFLLYKTELQNALELKNNIDVKVKIVIDLQNVIEL